jgi:sortase A
MPGSPGNAVMSGHNASRGSGVFRNLHKVKLDDTITVTVNGRNEDYVVTQRVILPQLYLSQKRRAESAAWLGFFGDERLTLITCYPWYTNTHWLIVVAHPVEPEKFGEAPGLTCPHESLQFPAPCW